MPHLTGHFDGHGLNDIIDIRADERDREKGGNGSHNYEIRVNHDGCSGAELESRPPNSFIQFQHGPRNVEGSKPGITEAVMYVILIDRLEGFQDGPFACAENEAQLKSLREGLALTRERADARAAQKVLGQNLPHVSN